MIVDAGREPPQQLEADVCVVGAGAAGITLARELAGSNLRVALLESGTRRLVPETQALYRGSSGELNYDNADLQRRMFGGSTTVWAGRCRPLDPVDFQPRPWLNASGWPLTQKDLDPYYARARRLCGINLTQREIVQWEARLAEQVGVEDLDVAMLERPAPLNFATAYEADLASARNITTYLNANVVGLERAGSRVEKVHASTLGGQTFSVCPRTTVLASGGVENPRLLLASNLNQSGLVGRFFMDHIYVNVGLLSPGRRRVPDQLCPGPTGHHGLLTIPERTRQCEALVSAAVYFIPRAAYQLAASYRSSGFAAVARLRAALRRREIGWDCVPPAMQAARQVHLLADSFVRRVWNRFADDGSLVARVVLEPTPNSESRIVLSRKSNSLGQPQAKIDWRPADLDRKSLDRFNEILASQLAAGGFGALDVQTRLWPGAICPGRHPAGATRMHNDPELGVVDENCRVHGLSNLYVAGSSVFPTLGFANPTLTILALTTRLADHLKTVTPEQKPRKQVARSNVKMEPA